MRACVDCGEGITACMGFVCAGDLLVVWTKELDTMPREICGKCVLWRTVMFQHGVITEEQFSSPTPLRSLFPASLS